MVDETDFRTSVHSTSVVSVVPRVGEHCQQEEFATFYQQCRVHMLQFLEDMLDLFRIIIPSELRKLQ